MRLRPFKLLDRVMSEGVTAINNLLDDIENKCPLCAKGIPVTSHLGGAEWIHSYSQNGQYTVRPCGASDLRVQHQDVLQDG